MDLRLKAGDFYIDVYLNFSRWTVLSSASEAVLCAQSTFNTSETKFARVWRSRSIYLQNSRLSKVDARVELRFSSLFHQHPTLAAFIHGPKKSRCLVQMQILDQNNILQKIYTIFFWLTCTLLLRSGSAGVAFGRTAHNGLTGQGGRRVFMVFLGGRGQVTIS